MTTYAIKLLPSGWTFPALEGASILHSAEAAGIDMPSSCRNGSCRTCLCRLESGSVRYLVEWPGISIEEKREGMILPCVAVPDSSVAVHAPLASRRA